MNQFRIIQLCSLGSAALLALPAALAFATPESTLTTAAVVQEPAPKPVEKPKPAPKPQDKKVQTPPQKQTPPKKTTGHGPGDGHNHGPGDGHGHGPGDGHGHGPGDGHNHGGQGVQGRYGGDVDPDAKLQIEFGAEKHDFGRVMQGEVLEHTFKMVSQGKNPLVVRQAKPTCGCTVGELMVEGEDGKMAPYNFGDAIPVGRKMELSASMDTKNKRNKTQVRINVFTNDPVGLHTLGLSATVEPFMTATPSFLNFGDVSEDAVKTSTIDIRTAKAEAVKLEFDDSRPIPKPQGMALELVPQSPDPEGRASHWQVKVTLGPGLKEGPLGYSLALKSDKDMVGAKPLPDGTQPKYSLNANVNGRVLGVLSCTPQYLSMGLVKPGQVQSRTVQLVSHDEKFSLDNVAVALEGYKGEEFPWKDHFATSIRPVAGKNAVDIELRLNGLPEGSDGSFKGQMMIQTGHESKPDVLVTFSGVCRGGIGRPPVRKRPTPAPQKKTEGN